MKFVYVLLLVVIGVALAFPRPPVNRRSSQQRAAARLRRAPSAAAARHRTMLISHGYYRPLYAHRRQGFEADTAMSAFAAGENLAAGTYLGTSCPACEQDTPNVAPEFVGAPEPNEEPAIPQDYPPLGEAPLSDPLADTEVAAPPPARKPKAPVKKLEDEDEESDEIPTLKGKGGSRTYFPVFLGGGSSRAAGGSGGVTAIANSYSSGKGGVANSHATAYGSGSSARRRSKRPVDDDEDEE